VIEFRNRFKEQRVSMVDTMLCGGDREKGDVAMEEKWDYVVSLHGDGVVSSSGQPGKVVIEFRNRFKEQRVSMVGAQ
jgi:hypothetical protein